MATLYQIDEELMSCIDAETGEITEPEKYESLSLSRDQKIENVLLWIKDLRSDAETYKAEAKSFQEKQKAAENKAANLTEWMRSVLNGEKFKTDRVQVSYRKSDRVEISDDAVIPEEFLKVTTTPNKAEIKKYLKQGFKIDGVELQEHKNMSIK